MRLYWILIATSFVLSACQKLEIPGPEEEWLRVYGDCMSTEEGQLSVVDVQANTANEFFLIGTYSTIAPDDLSLRDSCWIVKTDEDGKQIWSKTYSDLEIFPYPQAMSITPAGNLIILSNSVPNVSNVDISEIQLVEVDDAGEVVREKRFEIDGDDAYFGNDFAIDPTTEGVWIVGATTKIADPIGVVGDVTDRYLVRLDANWNILQEYLDGTTAADVGLTVNVRNNKVLMQSSREETTFGSGQIYNLLLDQATGATIDSFTLLNEQQVYPREVLFTDDNTWFVLYTPINLLSQAYLLRRFQNDTLHSELRFQTAAPLSMQTPITQNGSLILVGQEEGAGQTWTLRGINDLSTAVLTADKSFGVKSVSNYFVEFEKSIILDQLGQYIYIVGNQQRPTNNTSTANPCNTVVFLRLKL